MDLFGLYRQVCARGGWGDNAQKPQRKLNWSRDIFPTLANFTSTHKATSVGHDLITNYKLYLLSYEQKHRKTDTNFDEKKESALIGNIQRNTPRPGTTGTRSPGMASVGGSGGRKRTASRPKPSNLADSSRGFGGSGGGSSRGGGGGSSRGGGGGNGGGRNKTKRTFPDGAKIKVWWPKENDWFFGTIVQQEYLPSDGETYSKIEYEDGDEEVLNLAKEKVRLQDEDSDAEEEDLVYRPRPTARRRGASDPVRAPFAADTVALINAATGMFGDPDEEEIKEEDDERRQTRNRGADPNAPEPPPAKDRVDMVEEMMEHHNAAKVLAELPYEFCTEDETYRLGYRMGMRRAAKIATAMLIEKMQKLTTSSSEETMKCSIDEFFEEGGNGVITKEKAQELFNAIIDGAYTPDLDSDTYDAKGEPEMPQRAPEPADPENMPVMKTEDDDDEIVEEKKEEEKKNGGNEGDEKGPDPSLGDGGGSAGGSAGAGAEGAAGDGDKQNNNKDVRDNANGGEEDPPQGFHASMLADTMDIDIPCVEPKVVAVPVAAVRNSVRAKKVSKKVQESLETGEMTRSPIKSFSAATASANIAEPAAKRLKIISSTTGADNGGIKKEKEMRFQQTSLVHGTTTKDPETIPMNVKKTAAEEINEAEVVMVPPKAESTKPAAATAAPKITANGNAFVALPPVEGPPDWPGPPEGKNPDYLLHQLKVFIAKSGAHLDPAWSVSVAMRTQGASAGTIDATYWSPDGKRYRSRVEVARAVGVLPWVPPKKPKGEPRKPRDPNAPSSRSRGGSSRFFGGGGNFRKPWDSYAVVELKTPPPPPTKRVICELLGDGTAVRWLEKHGFGEHAAAFVKYGIMRKTQLFAPLLMQDMENCGLDYQTGIKVLNAIETTRTNQRLSSSSPHRERRVEHLTPVPEGRRITREVFCSKENSASSANANSFCAETYSDPGTFLFDYCANSAELGQTPIARTHLLSGLIEV